MPQKTGLVNADPGDFARELRQVTDALPSRISIDPDSVEQGLAKLVLTLIEFITAITALQGFDAEGWRRLCQGTLNQAARLI
jgi:hypothetical protein